MAEKFETVDEYIAAQPPETRHIVEEVRRRVREAVPSATETISYEIPTFKLGGKSFLYVAGWTNHVSIYPIPDTDAALTEDIERYRAGKGTLKFPLDEPFPFDLLDRLIAAAVRRVEGS